MDNNNKECSGLGWLLMLMGLAASCAAPVARDSEVLRFDVENQFQLEVPPNGELVQAWFALPDDREVLQAVKSLKVDVTPLIAGVETREVRDARGNRFLYLEGRGVAGRSLTITTTFQLVRQEARTEMNPSRTRALSATERAKMAAYLSGGSNIVIDDRVLEIARDVVGEETNPIFASRLIYNWVLDNVSYWVKHPDRMRASGVGNSQYCLAEGCGNCTDFHSLYTALSRASGIPTRMVYGSFFKGPLNGMDQDQSYHCWIEFWAPKAGWIPLDVAVADLFVDDFVISEANSQKVALTLADGYGGPNAELVDYYFGNLDARRVTWNRGRDLQLTPANQSGLVNALPKAHVEVDGKALAEKAGWTRKLTFRQL